MCGDIQRGSKSRPPGPKRGRRGGAGKRNILSSSSPPLLPLRKLRVSRFAFLLSSHSDKGFNVSLGDVRRSYRERLSAFKASENHTHTHAQHNPQHMCVCVCVCGVPKPVLKNVAECSQHGMTWDRPKS